MFGLLNILCDILLGTPPMKHSRSEFSGKAPEACKQCGMFMCIHKRANDSETVVAPPVPLGEDVANVVASDLDSPPTNQRIRVETKPPQPQFVPHPRISKPADPAKTHPPMALPPEGGTQNLAPKPNRILIPPPPRTKHIVPAASTYAKGWEQTFDKGNVVSSSTTEMDSDDEEWITCKICEVRAHVKFFDQHMLKHTKPSAISSGSPHRSVDTPVFPSPQSRPSTALATVAPPVKREPTKPKVTSLDTYRFRKIEGAGATSSVCQSGRYSDFTFVLLLENKPSSYSTHYSGGNGAQLYREYERIVIHLVYDSTDDFYTLSIKMLKRSSHSTYDTEYGGDLVVPERVCYQEEILSEIRKALLVYGVNPKFAHRHFLKMLQEDLVHERNEDGRPIITQTRGLAELNERMRKNAGHQWNRDDDNANIMGMH
jgi:hypothetical protein